MADKAPVKMTRTELLAYIQGELYKEIDGYRDEVESCRVTISRQLEELAGLRLCYAVHRKLILEVFKDFSTADWNGSLVPPKSVDVPVTGDWFKRAREVL